MTPNEIFEAVKDLTPYLTKRWYIDNKITEEDKKAYQKYKNTKRVLASRDKDANRETYKTYQNSLMKKIRDADRATDNEKQRRHNKIYREKIKKQNKIKDVLNDIIDDVVDNAEKRKTSAIMIQNAFRNKRAINEFADLFVLKQIKKYYQMYKKNDFFIIILMFDLVFYEMIRLELLE